MMKVECPEYGQQSEANADVLFLSNRFYCSLRNALFEVVEEDPLVVEAVDEEYFDSEGDEDDEREAE